MPARRNWRVFLLPPFAFHPEFVKQLVAIGLEPASSTPAEFHDMIRTELERWSKVIREAGITAEAAQ